MKLIQVLKAGKGNPYRGAHGRYKSGADVNSPALREDGATRPRKETRHEGFPHTVKGALTAQDLAAKYPGKPSLNSRMRHHVRQTGRLVMLHSSGRIKTFTRDERDHKNMHQDTYRTGAHYNASVHHKDPWLGTVGS